MDRKYSEEICKRCLIQQAYISCKHQNDLSFDSIKRYVRAFNYAYAVIEYLCLQDLSNLGDFISPKNNGFRCTPAIFENGDKAINSGRIQSCLSNLLDAYKEKRITPEEFFIEFESIHPYNDGNGRIGEILYYFMSGGSFDCPEYKFNYVQSTMI